jgi:hypothetical protein
VAYHCFPIRRKDGTYGRWSSLRTLLPIQSPWNYPEGRSPRPGVARNRPELTLSLNLRPFLAKSSSAQAAADLAFREPDHGAFQKRDFHVVDASRGLPWLSADIFNFELQEPGRTIHPDYRPDAKCSIP